MKLDITQIVIAVIGLMISAVSVYLIPYIRSKTTEEQRSKIRMWARIAVEAAEMIFREAGSGALKYQYVLDFLEAKGFQLNEQELKIFIESAVLEMRNQIAEG